MAEHLNLPVLLIISENPSVIFWLKKHLENQFFIIEAMHKERVLEAARTAPLDFIIIDSALEKTDPLEICTEIRNLPSNLLTPILLITDKLKKSYRNEALEAGVTDFLFQPLDVDELETRIAIGLKTREVREKVSGLSSRISAPKMKKKSTEQ